MAPTSRVGLALCGLILLAACRVPGENRGNASPAASVLHAPRTGMSLQALREMYVGRDVWVYGGGPLTCRVGGGFVDFMDSPLTPVHVVSLSRPHRKTAVPLRGGTILPRTVENPIVVRFRLPEGFRAVFGAGTGPHADPFRPAASGACREFDELYADEGHLGRELSLTPPPNRVRNLVRRSWPWLPGQPPSLEGLTHLEALWVRGAPEAPLTDVHALLQSRLWTWYGPPGRGDWTLSFEGDRVVAQTEPSPSP
ncbi:hypothetical protein DAERI_010186 [Deinococcus aerius]|uniref:Lipoprotein n=1 Tax=Deinococcus aerius TaxID=200253 RepID=A0A2I9CRA5_9DEIO|nr:hypothetical protein [Deinococcus aerius]GBF04014.1 hypothetical protein DAERI_010186 [Deinococcus aerius]